VISLRSAIYGLIATAAVNTPDCRCGREMQLSELRLPESRQDVEFRTFRCEGCGHRLKLTICAAPKNCRRPLVLFGNCEGRFAWRVANEGRLTMNTVREVLIGLRSAVAVGFWFLVVGGSLATAVWLFS